MNNISKLIEIIETLGGEASFSDICSEYEKISKTVLSPNHRITIARTLDENPDMVMFLKDNKTWKIGKRDNDQASNKQTKSIMSHNDLIELIMNSNNLSYKDYGKRVAIKIGNKSIAEVADTKKGTTVYMKAATVKITELYKSHIDLYEYHESPGYDNPFVFNGVTDLNVFITAMDRYADEIFKEATLDMEYRKKTADLIEEYKTSIK